MKVLVIDTETTGLPKQRNASIFQTTLWPHVVQLSFILYDTELEESSICKDYIIKIPESVELTEKSVEIHGITRKIINSKGVELAEALDSFDAAMLQADIVVAHNLSFDKKVLMVEARRLQRPQYFTNKSKGIKEYCTMKNTKSLCNIIAERSDKSTYVKYPTLSELHSTLFKIEPKGTHNAMADILICLRCYVQVECSKDIIKKPSSSIAKLFRLYCC